MWRSKRQVVIAKVVVVGCRGWRLILELVGFLLGRPVASQAAVAAVFEGGGEQVESFDEVGDGGVAEFVGQRGYRPRYSCVSLALGSP